MGECYLLTVYSAPARNRAFPSQDRDVALSQASAFTQTFFDLVGKQKQGLHDSKIQGDCKIDGETHNYQVEMDRTRQNRLESLGVNLLRFLDIDVKRNMDGILLSLDKWIDDFESTVTKTPPAPLKGGVIKCVHQASKRPPCISGVIPLSLKILATHTL